MLSKDYDFVLKMSTRAEEDLMKEVWKILDAYNYPSGEITYKFIIISEAYILNRYIEAMYLDGVEIGTFQIINNKVDVMETGYREMLCIQKAKEQLRP